MKIRILDLFCCGGAGAWGYRQGFADMGIETEIVGVDIDDHPNYPFKFVQSDALNYFDKHGSGFDFYHASPPCQSHSILNNVKSINKAFKRRQIKCFIEPTRERFAGTGKPYVIENVPGSPLIAPITICGLDVGLPMHGHRAFECFPRIPEPPKDLCDQARKKASQVKLIKRPITGIGSINFYRALWGCNWLSDYEMGQSIPPQFTRYIAHQMALFL